MRRAQWYAIAFCLLTVAAGSAILMFQPAITSVTAHSSPAAAYSTWKEYGGSPDDAQYSILKQIDRSNVSQLRQVWFYPAGNNGFRYGSNPIVIDDVMYVIGKNNSVVALEAATGKELWVHDNGKVLEFSHRGLVYWENQDRSDRRILYVANNMLCALDARTGNTIDSFGDHGSVDLREGLGRDPQSIRQIGSGTPGRIFGDLILMGSATGEEYESPPGDLRVQRDYGKDGMDLSHRPSSRRARLRYLAARRLEVYRRHEYLG